MKTLLTLIIPAGLGGFLIGAFVPLPLSIVLSIAWGVVWAINHDKIIAYFKK